MWRPFEENQLENPPEDVHDIRPRKEMHADVMNIAVRTWYVDEVI